ncbi:pimeloyl-ACP methyl ester esterase BioH [Aliikangiella coralliicola]|uniref:Pimeloyl-[acyl-carrier protein] methyl ester esterase n=1 Tax=Aliikangiella coralliicola TaxID=2592383 RepID=A0A545UJS7_9GAMM|nr:pimeloyl-ACP methyl ester esterase BioH [Aliikangiella coralliicola]TQV89716.1 pimeloyl-ACP methyl ester esterase BioH [Aliikangiella coralliicola]
MNLKPFVNISGTGPALVLIHGWGLHGGIWETVLPELEKHFTVHNIDMPGFGYSSVHNGEYNLDYLVNSIESVLPERCDIIGWSLGGLVATALALKCPDRISKLITVASNPSFVANEEWHGMQAQLLESFMAYLEEDYEGTLIRFLGIQTMGSATQKEDVKRLKETVFIHGQPSKKALRGGLKILHDINLVPLLSQLAMPVLRMYGRLDSLVPAKVAADVEDHIPGSKAIIYRKSAHAPFLSASNEFVDDVLEFLLPGAHLSEVSVGENAAGESAR